MRNIKNNTTLKAVLVLAIVVLCLSAVGLALHIVALKQAMGLAVEIEGWHVLIIRAITLFCQLVVSIAAIYYIFRGTALAAHNYAGVFLTVMIVASLVAGFQTIVAVQTWQFIFGVTWLSLMAWLLWRVLPKTSIKHIMPNNGG